MLETLKEALSPASEEAGETPTDEPLGTLEPVAYFYDAMPTGVTVSQRGRIFVNYPKNLSLNLALSPTDDSARKVKH